MPCPLPLGCGSEEGREWTTHRGRPHSAVLLGHGGTTIATTLRRYNHTGDYEEVNRLLVRTYRTTGGHVNWVQPRWEYMHFHPLIGNVDLEAIGVWEADGQIVAVAHPEHAMGTAYFEIDPDYAPFKIDMLRYAEEHLSTVSHGARRLSVLINEKDDNLQSLAAGRGYSKGSGCQPMSHLTIPDPFPPIPLPPGFQLKSLADENDLRKVDRVLWRGFDHGDEPPADGIEDREFMQSAPSFRKDLNIVVEAPDGNFVAYCGMWLEPVHAIAYVEPVATDPDYRRLGLGRASVLEGVRRCGAFGARLACVGSAMPFYRSLGFRQVYNRHFWHWRA